MNTYTTEPLDIVCNHEIAFKKLLIDGVCPFMEFYDSVIKDKQLGKDMRAIIAMMDSYSKSLLLPKTKFNHIEDHKIKNIFEFKKHSLRVYVLLLDTNVCVILGGFKKEQDADINRVKKILEDFLDD